MSYEKIKGKIPEIPKFFPEPQQNILPSISTPEQTTIINRVEDIRKFTTSVLEIVKSITGKYKIIDEDGEGYISECLLLSPSGITGNNDYKVQIFADGNQIYNDSWANFSNFNNYYSDMSAFDDGTYYVLSFQTISYYKHIKIEIIDSKANFDKIYLKKVYRIE